MATTKAYKKKKVYTTTAAYDDQYEDSYDVATTKAYKKKKVYTTTAAYAEDEQDDDYATTQKPQYKKQAKKQYKTTTQAYEDSQDDDVQSYGSSYSNSTYSGELIIDKISWFCNFLNNLDYTYITFSVFCNTIFHNII